MSTETTKLNGAALITAERQRQIDVEGHTPDHDDDHTIHEFVKAAGAYLGLCSWPWDAASFKKANGDGYYVERNLVKAGALIAASIDRLQRERASRG